MVPLTMEAFNQCTGSPPGEWFYVRHVGWSVEERKKRPVFLCIHAILEQIYLENCSAMLCTTSREIQATEKYTRTPIALEADSWRLFNETPSDVQEDKQALGTISEIMDCLVHAWT